MDLHQHCLYCSKTNSYIGAYNTHLHCDPNESIVYVPAEQQPDDSFAIESDTILHAFSHELHRNLCLHPSNYEICNTAANSDPECIDPEQPPVQTSICGTPHLDTCLATKPVSNKYFDIVDNKIDLWSPIWYEEEYRIVYWYIKHELSRAAINKRFRNPTMATICNFTLSNTVFKTLNEMCYAMGIDSWTSGKVYYNDLANPNNLCDTDSSHFFFLHAGECIEFLMQQPVFREDMLYAPAKKFNDAERHIDTEVKSCIW